MESLLLNDEQMLSLNQLISKLEEKFGKDYIYQPEPVSYTHLTLPAKLEV